MKFNIEGKLNNKKYKKINLVLTNSVINRIQYLLKYNSKILGIRIKIKKSGCAGFSYLIEEVFHPEKDDISYKLYGINIYISKNDIPLINGTKLDYVQDGLNNIFKFKNLNAKHFCGCGESFGL